MFIAGGISAALFHRDRTGEAVVLDVSLLSNAWWASGARVSQVMETDILTRNSMPGSGGASTNPFMGNFRTSDGGTINLCTISPTGHIASLFEHLGIPEAADDPRFSDPRALFENAAAASALMVEAFAKQPFEYWRKHLKTYSGQWAPIQSFKDLLTDEQALANDMIIEVEGADGGEPLKLVRGPVQWNGEALETTRAPQASEHTEIVLMEMGIEWDKIEELKAKGAIA
jgi:crotonobetainyl-CoA:carnitine CoA-transferase CaiB-like acyl-CoA transferase